jgi:aminoglycoside 6'-N-acetyltransferase
MSETAPRYAFRRMTSADLPLMAAWLAAPHVARWWGDPADELRDVEANLTSATVEPFIMLLDGEPVGYMQSYDIHAEDDHPSQDQPPGSIGIDMSIGRAELIGQGHGPRFTDAFVREIFARGAPRVVIDPDPTNAAAIRAYAKAGFRPLAERTSIYGPALIMVRDAEDNMRQP